MKNIDIFIKLLKNDNPDKGELNKLLEKAKRGKRNHEIEREKIYQQLEIMQKRLLNFKAIYDDKSTSIYRRKAAVMEIRKTDLAMDGLMEKLKIHEDDILNQIKLITQVENAMAMQSKDITPEDYDQTADLAAEQLDEHIEKLQAEKSMEKQSERSKEKLKKYREDNEKEVIEKVESISDNLADSKKDQEDLDKIFHKHLGIAGKEDS